jgi:hypothetical protein
MNSFLTSANQFLILEKKTEHLFKLQILSLYKNDCLVIFEVSIHIKSSLLHRCELILVGST